MMHSAVLLKAEVQALQKANQTANRCKKRQKKRVQQGGCLTIQEGQDILTQSAVEQQINQEMQQQGSHQNQAKARQ